ncbi:hypothetical protein ASG92_26330 [Arthrobacter sp. Soil736]|nr:hypothetical protein ASG92_26330 [Arthrobacter sp. Soil736]
MALSGAYTGKRIQLIFGASQATSLSFPTSIMLPEPFQSRHWSLYVESIVAQIAIVDCLAACRIKLSYSTHRGKKLASRKGLCPLWANGGLYQLEASRFLPPEEFGSMRLIVGLHGLMSSQAEQA